MSFLIDFPALLGLGVLFAYITKKRYKPDSFLLYTLSILVLALFYGIAIGFFVELPFLQMFGESSCRFMYSSGFLDVPFNNLAELMLQPFLMYLGIFLFCLYPVPLYLGTQLGYGLFGRKPGDKGLLGLI